MRLRPVADLGGRAGGRRHAQRGRLARPAGDRGAEVEPARRAPGDERARDGAARRGGGDLRGDGARGRPADRDRSTAPASPSASLALASDRATPRRDGRGQPRVPPVAMLSMKSPATSAPSPTAPPSDAGPGREADTRARRRRRRPDPCSASAGQPLPGNQPSCFGRLERAAAQGGAALIPEAAVPCADDLAYLRSRGGLAADRFRVGAAQRRRETRGTAEGPGQAPAPAGVVGRPAAGLRAPPSAWRRFRAGRVRPTEHHHGHRPARCRVGRGGDGAARRVRGSGTTRCAPRRARAAAHFGARLPSRARFVAAVIGTAARPHDRGGVRGGRVGRAGWEARTMRCRPCWR